MARRESEGYIADKWRGSMFKVVGSAREEDKVAGRVGEGLKRQVCMGFPLV